MQPSVAYSFLDTQVNLIGPGAALSLGAGAANAEEGISIEFLEETDTMTIGADGTPMHSLHASKGGRARVTLLKTSPMNNALTLVYNLQRTSGALWGQNILVLTHTALGDVYTCQSVAFTKFPSNDYGKEARFLVWEFNVGIIDPLLGTGSVLGV